MPEPTSPQPPQSRATDLDRLNELLAPARELAAGLVPTFPRLPDVPGTADSRRPSRSVARVLDVESAAPGLREMDAVLDAVHDIAVAVFQRWLDQLAGQACPLLDQNRQLVELVQDRADRYGLGLYCPHDGTLSRVRVDALPVTNKTPSPEYKSAGKFRVRTRMDPSVAPHERTVQLERNLSGAGWFPSLVVARTQEQAEQIWRARQDRSTDDSQPG